jgi:Zn-dependent protease with chaperone function
LILFMATDFYQRQHDARRSTVWLVVLFALAVISMVGLVVTIAALLMQSQAREPDHFPSIAAEPEQVGVPLIAGAVTLLIIGGGSLFKILSLRSGGGTRVAEHLGGRRLFHNTADAVERRLLNVVEEMAIASGTPVPPVYLLDEQGINAFAAGYSPSDAVLGVTRGCAEQLSRDELQGVIAHEFSHILNGDMRMSIKLIGVLHGILLLGLTGQLILRMFFYSGAGRARRRNDGGGNGNGNGQMIIVILAIAVALLVLGFIGTLFGNLIKAAVSRQREYLADASAVQFTRNPGGIAGALKRIGAAVAGSRLQAPAAAEASHMYFAQGVWEGFSGLWATHPPLTKRIRAIEPNWDGKFPAAARRSASIAAEAAVGFAGASSHHSDVDEVPVEIVDHAAEHVGEPTREHWHYAAQLVARLPQPILNATHEAYSARAVIYCLLIDREPQVRRIQMAALAAGTTADMVRLVSQFQPQIDPLDARVRLPLVEMSLPALRSMSRSQYQEFHDCFVELAKADNRIGLFEWMLSQVMMRHLRPQFEPITAPRIEHYGLQRLGQECSVLLSIVAAAGNTDAAARVAFAAGARQLHELILEQQPRSSRPLDELLPVLDKLRRVAVKHRGRIVDACAAAICADQHVQWQEAELLRGISDLLDCPMPPLLVA